MIHDIKYAVNNWDDKLGEINLMIPNNLENPFRNAKSELIQTYNKCLDKGITIEDVSKLKSIVFNQDSLIEEIKNHIENHKNNEWLATLNIEKWLIKNRKFAVLNILKQDGIITKEIAYEIYESRFMKFISNRLRNIFSKKNIAGWEPKQEEKGYLIKTQNMRLIVDHKKVIEKYWNYIYSNVICDNYSFEDIISISTIYSKDYDKAEKELRKYFFMPRLSLYSVNHTKDEVLLREKGINDSYLRYRFVPFINECKMIIFNIPGVNIEGIQNKILNASGIRYKFEEIRSYEKQMQRDIYEAGRFTKRKAKGR